MIGAMTEDSDDRTRLVIHALLDMVSVFDADAPHDQNLAAETTAFERLNQLGAVDGTFDDETDEFTLNITPLLNAFGYVAELLIGTLALEKGMDRLALIATLREQADKDHPLA